MESSITQGTLITSIRSEKYDGINCFGIVITARCDLANNKIQKIFYLEAIELEKWILSKSGFDNVINSLLKSISSDIEKNMSENGLEWNEAKNFSVDEFAKIIDEGLDGECAKKKNQIKNNFKKYKKYTNSIIASDEKKIILQEQIKTVKNAMVSIANGQNSYYVYIPPEAIDNNVKYGLIVDLQQLDYFDMDLIKDLSECSIDIKNRDLDEEKIKEYDKRFFLSVLPGYSIALCNMKSPWIEYLMQHFSNLFARIGVNNPSKEDISEIIDNILND